MHKSACNGCTTYAARPAHLTVLLPIFNLLKAVLYHCFSIVMPTCRMRADLVSLLFQCHAYLQNGRRLSCSAGQSGPLEDCIWPAEGHECSLVWAACHQRSRGCATCRHRQVTYWQFCCLEMYLLTAIVVWSLTAITVLRLIAILDLRLTDAALTQLTSSILMLLLHVLASCWIVDVCIITHDPVVLVSLRCSCYFLGLL